MKLLVLGGSKSGKSYFSQRAAKQLSVNQSPLFYLATMDPVDGEDLKRIERHRAEREGWGFITLEYPRQASLAAGRLDSSSVLLLDSVTSLFTNEMFSQEGFRSDAADAVYSDISTLASKAGDIVLVSDLLFSDSLSYDDMTEAFRRGLGHLHQRLGQLCDTVVLLRQSIPQYIKGSALPEGDPV